MNGGTERIPSLNSPGLEAVVGPTWWRTKFFGRGQGNVLG